MVSQKGQDEENVSRKEESLSSAGRNAQVAYHLGFLLSSEAREVDKRTLTEPLLVLRVHDHLENFISEMNEQTKD